MSDAVCRLPRGFVALTLRSARCFMNLIFLITSLVWGGVVFFLMQEAVGKEALMNFQRQLQCV